MGYVVAWCGAEWYGVVCWCQTWKMSETLPRLGKHSPQKARMFRPKNLPEPKKITRAVPGLPGSFSMSGWCAVVCGGERLCVVVCGVVVCGVVVRGGVRCGGAVWCAVGCVMVYLVFILDTLSTGTAQVAPLFG